MFPAITKSLCGLCLVRAVSTEDAWEGGRELDTKDEDGKKELET